MEHIWESNIIDKGAFAGQKSRVFAALQRLACVAHPAPPSVARTGHPAIPDDDWAVRFHLYSSPSLAWERDGSRLATGGDMALNASSLALRVS
jgi:hypothetical protein